MICTSQNYGGIVQEGKELIFKIGELLINKTGNEKAKNYLILSMTIQGGNAASFLGVVAL